MIVEKKLLIAYTLSKPMTEDTLTIRARIRALVILFVPQQFVPRYSFAVSSSSVSPSAHKSFFCKPIVLLGKLTLNIVSCPSNIYSLIAQLNWVHKKIKLQEEGWNTIIFLKSIWRFSSRSQSNFVPPTPALLICDMAKRYMLYCIDTHQRIEW